LEDLVRAAALELAAEACPKVAELCRDALDRAISGSVSVRPARQAEPELTRRDLAGMIDHTNLRPTAVRADVERLVEDAVAHGFAAVCVNPVWVPLVRRLLDGASAAVRLCTVAGFPLGADLAAVKADEARRLRDQGADEIDMVINLGALKDRDYREFVADARAVLDASKGCVAKAIIEACYLEDAEKVKACILLDSLGYNFVKTSTGFGKHGATQHDVRLMRAATRPGVGVKAAGGIRSFEDALLMVKAGAGRIGTSAGVEIVRG
jgi:deoxyribose-phosphate aldolase